MVEDVIREFLSQWENLNLSWLPYFVLMKKVELVDSLVVGELKASSPCSFKQREF